jgi:hypothetical protein
MHRHGRFALSARVGDQRVAHEVDNLGVQQVLADFGKLENAHGRVILSRGRGLNLRIHLSAIAVE